jgi:hypothetical protein
MAEKVRFSGRFSIKLQKNILLIGFSEMIITRFSERMVNGSQVYM